MIHAVLVFTIHHDAAMVSTVHAAIVSMIRAAMVFTIHAAIISMIYAA
jgi:hypothetical protein